MSGASDGRGGVRATPEELLVAVSIDTECDHDRHWRRSAPLAFRSIVEGLPERLQPAFAEVGAVPTYLLTAEVMEDERAVAALRALDGPHELGTHLHAAFVAPERRYRRGEGVSSPDFQCLLPAALERAKLETLTSLFRARFGRAPRSFRAGRYAAGPATLASLEALGYAVDTSVVPGTLWREREPPGRASRLAARLAALARTPRRAVDFRGAPEQPYFPADDRLARPGRYRPGRPLEVPVSVRPASWFAPWSGPTWFRPRFASVERMKAVVRHQLARHRAPGRAVVVNMMFHSMEVIEGASPYPQSADEVRRFLDDMREALGWCAREGARFVPLAALRRRFAPANEGEAGGALVR